MLVWEEKCPVNLSRIQICWRKTVKKGRENIKSPFLAFPFFCILSRLSILSFYLVFSQRSDIFLFFRVLSWDHVFPTLLFHPIFYSSFVTFIHRKWFSNFFILFHLFLHLVFFSFEILTCCRQIAAWGHTLERVE